AALYRRIGVVSQVLHEHAATLSAAGPTIRSRRLIKCAKDSGQDLSGGTRNEQVLRRLANGSSARAQVMRNTLDAVARISAAAASVADVGEGDRPMGDGMMMDMAPPDPVITEADADAAFELAAPTAEPVNYGSGELATALKTIADIAKAEIGLTVATADFGGWDTHDAQAGRFQTQVLRLSQALSALHADLAGFGDRLTVLVMSEFGRRLIENQNRGTDHGHGSVVMVSGIGVKGGLYGSWPGLKSNALDQGLDLAITTDYRRVIAEVLTKRAGQTRIAEVFPTLGGGALGLV
ncbi:MAG: DUF1501 domain-containing protein, partial [Alphaproteobacteria bacterium]|nr:DUF1501 domain-containing protein [Alphaproteobacteria bacterium]